VLSVGRLEKYKGHHRLIDAMPQVLAIRPTVRLKILGVGPYEETLREKVQQMGLADKIEITHIPPKDRTGMTREMLSATLVTLFSEYEAHPVAVMEAAALGCSILVADTSGLGELAEKGLARAIPLNSTTEQLAQAILHQLDHPHHVEAVTVPTWDSCTAQLLGLYQQVVSCES
jgi:glycogen synthase